MNCAQIMMSVESMMMSEVYDASAFTAWAIEAEPPAELSATIVDENSFSFLVVEDTLPECEEADVPCTDTKPAFVSYKGAKVHVEPEWFHMDPSEVTYPVACSEEHGLEMAKQLYVFKCNYWNNVRQRRDAFEWREAIRSGRGKAPVEVEKSKKRRSVGTFGCLVRGRLRRRKLAKAALREMFKAFVRAMSKQKEKSEVFTGQAQWGIPINLSAEHVVKIPVVETLVKALTEKTQGRIDWKKFIIEVAFAFAHLLQGGLTMKNMLLCASHLFYEVGLPPLMKVFEDLAARVHCAAQSLESGLVVLGTFVAGLVSVFSIYVFSKLPDTRNIDMLINRFSKVGACMTSASKVWGLGELVSKYLVDFIRCEILGMASSDLQEFESIDKFCDEVMELNTPDMTARCEADTGLIRTKVTTLLQQADAILARLDALKLPYVQTQRFKNTCLFLAKVRDTLDKTAPGLVSARIPPMMLHIYGNTGVGKSSALNYLNARLLVALGSRDPNDLHNKVYYRNPGSEFYDGFKNGTQIVVNDDFGTIRDSEVRPSPEPVDMIRQANTAPFKPVMADLSGKANAVFEAAVVINTSNRASFKFPSLTNPEAVANRIHLRFRQFVHPDFSTLKNLNGQMVETLDKAKVAAAAVLDKDAWRKCMLFQQEATEGLPLASGNYTPIGEPLSFEEFAEKCVEYLKRHREIGGTMRTECEEYYRAVIAGQPQAGEDVCGNMPYAQELRTQAREGEFPNEPPRLDTVQMSAFELSQLLRAGNQVQMEAPMVTFERPHWTLGLLGKRTHINVVASMLAAFGQGEGLPPCALSEDAERFLQNTCWEVSAYHAQAFWNDLYVLNVRLMSGERDEPIFAEFYSKWCGYYAPCIQGHIDGCAERTWRGKMAQCAQEIATSGMMRYFTLMDRIARRHPRTGIILTILSSAAFMFALKKACGWLLSKVYETFVEGVSYVVGKIVPGPSGEHEAYPNGTVKSTKVIVTEKYPDGTVRGRPVVSTEAYPNTAPSSRPPVRTEAGGEAEGLTDQNADEVRTKVFMNAYHLLTRKDDSEPWCPVGTFTVLKGRVGITNRHVFAALQDKVMLRSAYCNMKYEFPKSQLNIAFVEDSAESYGMRDVGIAELPVNVHPHKSIVEHFMTGEDFSRHEELARLCLMKYVNTRTDHSVMVYQETDRAKAFHKAHFDLLMGGNTKRVRLFYCYAMETKGGDCGGVLVSFDKRFNRKIVGIHMAGGALGNGYTAAGAAVTQDFIGALKERLTLKYQHSWFDNTITVDKPAVAVADDGVVNLESAIEDGVVFHGRADTRVHASTMSAITPSPVHDICGPVQKKPARLTRFYDQDGELRVPLRIAMKKVCTPSVLVEADVLEAATNQVEQMMCVGPMGDRRTLTYLEAITGIEGDECYPAINRSTSPGYGWRKIGKGKTAFLGTDEFVITPEVTAAYEECVQKLKAGERVCRYWTDTLKDELRPVAKVDQGKTRLFSAGEMILTILLRQYFQGFCAHLTRNKITMESCVGVNPYSQDWSAIAFRLSEHGPRVVAGDFANYDGTIPADVLWNVLRLVNKFYAAQGPEEEANNKIRELLWFEIVNSVHVQGDCVYSWTHSNPSGCPFTSILNSVAHSIIARCAFLISARKYAPEKASLTNFTKYVNMVDYGDDDVFNIAEEASFFNQVTMAEAYATFGMTYTDEAKTGVLQEFKTLEEIQFLKRAFVWDADQARYLAPLDINTIREMPCWNKTKGDKYLLTADCLEDAVYELAQHPREVFNDVMPMFERARQVVATRVPCFLSTFDEIRWTDMYRYCLPGVKSDKALKLRDRGIDAMAARVDTANPAGVGALPNEVKVYSEGGVFTPSGKCVPSKINRLLALPALWWTRSSTTESDRPQKTRQQQFQEWLAEQPEHERPSMCFSSWLYQDPDIRKFHRFVENCPCDFHGGYPAYAYLKEKFFLAIGEPWPLSGKAQAGETPEESVENPNFAGGEPHDEEEEILTFHQDGATASADRALDAPLPPVMHDISQDLMTHDVKAFLRRPIQVQDFVWNSSHALGSELAAIDLPFSWLNYPMIKEKLAGFRYLRCTLNIEIVINAQPMNAGLLIGYFNPVANQNTFQPSSVGHLGGQMGYPHVFYRLGDVTAVRMKIPFFPLVSHFDLVTKYGTMGIFTLAVASMLTGTNDVDGSIFIWADDVEVAMPTGLQLFTGSAQAGKVEERKRPGNVETAAKTLGGIAGALTGVPVIGEAAGIAKTVLGGVGSIASMFGWSKPIDPEYVTEVGMKFGQNMANFNGDAKPKVLALDVRNTTDIPTDVFNTTEDEMSFNSFLKKPVYADRFTFAGSQAQGTIIHRWPVDPSACVKVQGTVGTDPVVYRQETFLSYLASCARFWHGGLKFHYKIIKTGFHTGRLRFTYVPGATLATDPVTVDINKCYSQIHDLNSASDVEFTIPYNFFQPWKATDTLVNPAWPPTGPQWAQTCYEVPQGMIYVSILNALRNPTTVESSVDVLLMVSAADDFQLAVPYAQPRLKVLSRKIDVPTPTFTGNAQAGNLFETKSTNIDLNACSIGEAFTGFRQWLKRYHPFVPDDRNDRSHPFIFNNGDTLTVAGDLAVDFDPFRRASVLYRFMSGSMRVMYTPTEPKLYKTFGFSGVPLASDGDVSLNRAATGSACASTTSSEPLMEFEIPFYQVFPALLTDTGFPLISTPLDGDASNFGRLPYNKGTALIIDPSPASEEAHYRAIGESFSFGFALGVPFTFVPTTV